MDVKAVHADLVAEQADLDAIVSTFSDEQWASDSPSPRWSLADQIGHLTYFDETAAIAITDPERFRELATQLAEMAASAPTDVDDLTLGQYRSMAPTQLLEAWRTNRATLSSAAEHLANDDRVIWYGPSMGSRSFLTARLMETWAHGQDIVDTVGAERAPSDRLRHIAQLGFITRDWSYKVRGLDPLNVPVSVSLEAPSGGTWEFGPADATARVAGPAQDFCLIVTQRRHLEDTTLEVVGDAARDWMLKAQAFAGGPTEGPAAGAWA